MLTSGPLHSHYPGTWQVRMIQVIFWEKQWSSWDSNGPEM